MREFVRSLYVLLTVVLLSSHATADIRLSENFDGDDGGFTASGAIPWTYNSGAGTWSTNGAEGVVTGELSSPAVDLPTSGPVTLSFDHRYNFEYDGTVRWDGGAVQVSVNGGPFEHLAGTSFTQNGYIGVITGNNVLNNMEGFNDKSADYAAGSFITSNADLGVLSAGDTIAVRFVGAWDEGFVETPPNWEITSVVIDQPVAPAAVPTLSMWGFIAFSLCTLGFGAFLLSRRTTQPVAA